MRAITLLSFESSTRRAISIRSACCLTHLIYSNYLTGCFLLLKHAYSREITGLICYYINHVTKLEFLLAVKAAYIP